jgi:hypothetical protein
MEGYDVFNLNRSSKKGGGVMIYVSKLLKCKKVINMSQEVNDIYECITIEIESTTSRNVIVTCMYRAPGSNIDNFILHLEELLKKVQCNKSFFLVGDLNINLINYTKHNGTRNFIDTIYSYCVLPLINKPTRINTESCTLIDNIFTNNVKHFNSGILINDLSDHLPIFTILEDDNCLRENTEKYIFKRQNKEKNLNEFQLKLSQYDWEPVTQATNIDEAYCTFINAIKQLYDITCPIKKVKLKKQIKQPWLTNGLINACKKQKTLYRKFIQSRSIECEKKYKNYKNKLTSIKRFCKKDYYNKLLENNKNNTKGTWRVLNEILNKGQKQAEYPETFRNENGSPVKGYKNIANSFNKFFVNVGPKLAKKIKNVDNNSIFDYLSQPNNNSMFLNPVDEQEVINTVNECKNKTSEDYDSLSMKTIKVIIHSILQPLTYICNLSFEKGTVPDMMKISKVIPLFKAGDKSTFTNYRPVALLPQFSKILEKLFCKRLTKFIENHNLLSECQYGFRPKRSTSLAILDLVEELTNALDDNKFTIGVFIDLRKAFDTIDHELLIKKMEYFGIRGVVNNWLSSYLSNRKQYVQINNSSSNLLDMVCGVPQGSVLGPILFIMYINDICNVSSILKMILFADDTNLFKSGYNINSLCTEMSQELSKLNTWFSVNKLSLNVSKTNFILFAGKKCINDINININNENIERVYSTKFLGVLIDSKLTWKEHIRMVKGKLLKCVGILYKCAKIIDTDTSRTLYCSLFLPHINYCCEIWGMASDSLLHCVLVLQKRAIRTICREYRYAHTSVLFYNLRLFKFSDLVKFKINLIMFKAFSLQLPCNLQRKFELAKYENYTLRSLNKFKIKYTKTALKAKSISIYGVKIFNALPKEISNITVFAIFKKKYKSQLISQYL